MPLPTEKSEGFTAAFNNAAATMEDILRQRKLLLWRKILENFDIEPHIRDRITRRILPQSVVDVAPPAPPPKDDAPHDNTKVAPHCL